MLKFDGIEFWGDPEEFAVNPPVIVIEVFDMDKELIGSVSLTFWRVTLLALAKFTILS